MNEEMRANGDKTAHVTADGRLYLGGEEFMYPIAADSIKVEQLFKGRHHLLTMTIIVGAVEMEQRPRRAIEPETP